MPQRVNNKLILVKKEILHVFFLEKFPGANGLKETFKITYPFYNLGHLFGSQLINLFNILTVKPR